MAGKITRPKNPISPSRPSMREPMKPERTGYVPSVPK